MEDRQRRLGLLDTELGILRREAAASGGHAAKIAELQAQRTSVGVELEAFRTRWQQEQELVGRIRDLRQKLEEAAVSPGEGSAADTGALRDELAAFTGRLHQVQGETPLVQPCVDGGLLLIAIARETFLSKPPAPEEGKGAPLSPTSPLVLAARHVDDHFHWLSDLVNGREGAPPLLDSLLHMLDETYRQANQGAGDAVGQRLRDEATRLPGIVGDLVGTLAQSVSEVTGVAAHKALNQRWAAEVLPLCRKAIEGRYPFVQNSSIDMALDDFTRLFAPGGLIDGYFTMNLASWVDTSGAKWCWLPGEAEVPSFSNSALAQFQRAAAIRDSFFFVGGATPTVPFELTPVDLSPNATRVLLDIDGQMLDYAHEPPVAQSMQWPGPNGPKQARLVFSPPLAGREASVTRNRSLGVIPHDRRRRCQPEDPVRPARSDFRCRRTLGEVSAACRQRRQSFHSA